MSMRVYVRLEKVTDLPDGMRGTHCHVKLLMGNVIMRTKSKPVDEVKNAIHFTELATGRLDELFVLSCKSMDHLLNAKLRVQLRRHRWFLRSKRVAEAIIPLALVDPARSLKAAFPMLPVGDNGDVVHPQNGQPPFGHMHVRIEIELDAPPQVAVAPRLTEEAVEEHSLLHTTPTESAKPNVQGSEGGSTTPRSFSMMQQPQTSSRSRMATTPNSAARVRQSGTQTDRLFMSGEDLRGIAEGFPPPSDERQGSGSMVNIARLGPPPSAEALEPRRSFLPVDVLAQQSNAIARPTDDVQGLMLYCEQTQRYQRELEATLAKHHLDTTRSRLKALQSVGIPLSPARTTSTATPHERRPSSFVDPMASLPIEEDTELEHLLSIL